jgi:hypothetical protein
MIRPYNSLGSIVVGSIASQEDTQANYNDPTGYMKLDPSVLMRCLVIRFICNLVSPPERSSLARDVIHHQSIEMLLC